MRIPPPFLQSPAQLIWILEMKDSLDSDLLTAAFYLGHQCFAAAKEAKMEVWGLGMAEDFYRQRKEFRLAGVCPSRFRAGWLYFVLAPAQ